MKPESILIIDVDEDYCIGELCAFSRGVINLVIATPLLSSSYFVEKEESWLVDFERSYYCCFLKRVGFFLGFIGVSSFVQIDYICWYQCKMSCIHYVVLEVHCVNSMIRAK
jgi:hypothetical protein